jgi:hypothetical protein
VATFAQTDAKGWVDVNFGGATPAEDGYAATYRPTIFRETATFGVAYSIPTGAEFDFGGGYMFTPRVGFGINFSGTSHQDFAALAISIPHPTIANRFASDAGVTDEKFERREGAINLHAMFNLAETSRLRVRAFAGPTYFRVQQHTIDDIRYNQIYNLLGVNSVDITSWTASGTEGNGWGFHGGADVSVFFNRIVGIGGQLKVSRGSADIIDIGNTIVNVKAGGVHYGGGLRLRF